MVEPEVHSGTRKEMIFNCLLVSFPAGVDSNKKKEKKKESTLGASIEKNPRMSRRGINLDTVTSVGVR